MRTAFRLIDRVIEDGSVADLRAQAGEANREDWERMLVGGSREMRQLHHIIRLVAAAAPRS